MLTYVIEHIFLAFVPHIKRYITAHHTILFTINYKKKFYSCTTSTKKEKAQCTLDLLLKT